MTKQRLTFIGRQYHSKTKSDQMILDLLKTDFEITLIRREQYTDAELVRAVNDSKPDVIFFWCLPPSSTKHLWKMHCKNVVWAPMWDGFRPLKFRKRMLITLSKVKVICFSQALYNYFKKTKIRAKYFQCSLKPNFATYTETGPYTVFLWQREEKINIRNIAHFLGEENIKKVIYKSEIGVDTSAYPFEVEVLPDWLEKEDYLAKLREADFYVAPRVSEGIGFSFLEAMSLGKVLLAYNESTMNEYVVDGENGYLFDEEFRLKTWLRSPKTLSEKIEEHAKNAYLKWQKDKEQIIPFILEK